MFHLKSQKVPGALPVLTLPDLLLGHMGIRVEGETYGKSLYPTVTTPKFFTPFFLVTIYRPVTVLGVGDTTWAKIFPAPRSLRSKWKKPCCSDSHTKKVKIISAAGASKERNMIDESIEQIWSEQEVTDNTFKLIYCRNLRMVKKPGIKCQGGLRTSGKTIGNI